MKKMIVIVAVTFGMAGTTVLAQMDGGMGAQGGAGAHRQDTGTQQSQQMMSGQMVSQEMMRDMSGMMRQMNDMTQSMSRVMESSRTMDPARARDMSKLMQEMSVNMRELSQQMAKGNMDPKTTQQMQERINRMNQTLNNLQTEKR